MKKPKDNPPAVDYKCLDCGKGFSVPQGSRRNYCDACTADRVAKRK